MRPKNPIKKRPKNPKKKKREKKGKKEKNERKERRGNVTILLPHLCFKVAARSS